VLQHAPGLEVPSYEGIAEWREELREAHKTVAYQSDADAEPF
jgi:hypothetical protein